MCRLLNAHDNALDERFRFSVGTCGRCCCMAGRAVETTPVSSPGQGRDNRGVEPLLAGPAPSSGPNNPVKGISDSGSPCASQRRRHASWSTNFSAPSYVGFLHERLQAGPGGNIEFHVPALWWRQTYSPRGAKCFVSWCGISEGKTVGPE